MLSGATAGRAWRSRCPLDVLIAAPSPKWRTTRGSRCYRSAGSLLLGRAVGDVIHLLAELIENAPSFSPPHDGRVAGPVVSQRVRHRDRGPGLGMSEEELARERAAAQSAGLSASPRRPDSGCLWSESWPSGTASGPAHRIAVRRHDCDRPAAWHSLGRRRCRGGQPSRPEPARWLPPRTARWRWPSPATERLRPRRGRTRPTRRGGSTGNRGSGAGAQRDWPRGAAVPGPA